MWRYIQLLLLTICFADCSLILKGDFFSDILKDVLRNNNSETLCFKDLKRYISDLELKKKWALFMSDSTSKGPSGFLYSAFTDLGNYDQCVNIREDADDNRIVFGKYCQIKTPFQDHLPNDPSEHSELDFFLTEKCPHMHTFDYCNPSLKLSICVPDSCSEKDLEGILQLAPNLTKYDFIVENCQVQEKESFNATDWLVIVFFLIILIIIISSTVYDLDRIKHDKPFICYYTTFSLYSNAKSLFSTKAEPGHIGCLDGLRVISTLWIISMHVELGYAFMPLSNGRDVEELGKMLIAFPVRMAHLSVDTFFLISGFVLVKTFLANEEKKRKFKLFQYYFHRYVRLTPAMLAVILFHITMLRFLISGPAYTNVVDTLQGFCANYWWSALLHIQNLANSNEICVIPAWYLSTDFQLYLLSPLILIPLRRWPKFTCIGLAAGLGISIIASFVVAYVYQFHAVLVTAFMHENFIGVYYANPVTRMAPWLFGILLGYYVHTNQRMTSDKNEEEIPTNVNGIIASFVVFNIVVFGSYTMIEYDRIPHSLYIALHRIIWSVAIANIIYICVCGEGGFLNKFLSHPVFRVLSRLTFSMYILHMTILLMVRAQSHQPVFLSIWLFIEAFLGNLPMTFLLSVIWTLAFEMPLINFERLYIRNMRRAEAKQREILLNNNIEKDK